MQVAAGEEKHQNKLATFGLCAVRSNSPFVLVFYLPGQGDRT
jgi:hypothetical protein